MTLESDYEFPEFGPPFPAEEYRRRVERTRAEMARRGLDTLLVTSPPNITYLTGYDSIWYHVTTPTAVALRAEGDGLLFLDSAGHRDLVPAVARTEVIDEVAYFGLGQAQRAPVDDAAYATPWVLSEAVATLLGALGRRGWLRGRVGIERWSRSPGWPVMQEVEVGVKAAGAEAVDGSWCIDAVRMVKSPLELLCVRKAAGIANAAMQAVREAIAPGMTEIEVQALAQHEMGRRGGEEPAIRTAVRSGPRGAAHHSPPTRRRFQRGDLVWVDFSASFNRYHVDIARTFSIGEPDARWKELLAASAGSVEAVVSAVRPGDPLRRVQEVADAYIDARGLRRHAWWIGGYALGIAIPPNWVDHAFFGGDGFEEMNFDPGVVMNYENVYDVVTEDWPGGRGCSFIETFLMTEDGIEVLTTLPRELTVV